jgi:hypothetical protein
VERGGVQGLGWPSVEQRSLLSVLLAAEDEAGAAWFAWRGRVALDGLDVASRRLLPLVAARLDRLGIAEPELARLRGVARHTWASNHCHVRAGLEGAASLARAGIRVCALKGLGLLDRYYDGDFAARPMYDVDLLVAPEQAADAAGILESLGFRSEPPITRRSLAARGIRRGMAHAFRRGSSSIDLHWHVLHQDRSRFFDTLAWAHAARLTRAGDAGVLALSATEHLMHICLHGVRHDASANRIWPLDAVRIIDGSQGEIDWERLVQIARDRCLTVALLDALRFVATLTARIPAGWLEQLAAGPVSSIELLEYRAITSRWRDVAPRARAAALRMVEVRRRFEKISPEALRALE